jgi:hypothetical protein
MEVAAAAFRGVRNCYRFSGTGAGDGGPPGAAAETVKSLAETGFFRLLQPARFGGSRPTR